MKVVVVGLGYVGMPLVVEACVAGLKCVGFDLSEELVAGLNLGKSHIDDVSADALARCLDEGFYATTDAACMSDADVVVICVPTPLDSNQNPDLSAVELATETIRAYLHPGMVVILESTTYPGTTDGLVKTSLERSGMKAGNDFALAFSPERIDPGNPTYNLRNTPKLVGGYTDHCADAAVDFYSRIVDTVVRVSGTKEAEMAKLLENTYRHVNIALVNEMAIFSHDMGIDIWEVIAAAKTKPFGFTAFYPGPGVGGHCIPIDPNYLSHSVRSLGYQFRFVELAQEISNRMPAYVVRRVQDALNDLGLAIRGSRIAVLGLTYKSDIADDRETPARPILRRLIEMGASVVAHDPHLDNFQLDGTAVEVAGDIQSAVKEADLTLLLQAHGEYSLDEIARHSNVVFDTRGVMRQPNVVRL